MSEKILVNIPIPLVICLPSSFYFDEVSKYFSSVFYKCIATMNQYDHNSEKNQIILPQIPWHHGWTLVLVDLDLSVTGVLLHMSNDHSKWIIAIFWHFYG